MSAAKTERVTIHFEHSPPSLRDYVTHFKNKYFETYNLRYENKNSNIFEFVTPSAFHYKRMLNLDIKEQHSLQVSAKLVENVAVCLNGIPINVVGLEVVVEDVLLYSSSPSL
jgi:hypothetical protein